MTARLFIRAHGTQKFQTADYHKRLAELQAYKDSIRLRSSPKQERKRANSNTVKRQGAR